MTRTPSFRLSSIVPPSCLLVGDGEDTDAVSGSTGLTSSSTSMSSFSSNAGLGREGPAMGPISFFCLSAPVPWSDFDRPPLFPGRLLLGPLPALPTCRFIAASSLLCTAREGLGSGCRIGAFALGIFGLNFIATIWLVGSTVWTASLSTVELAVLGA